MLPAPREVPDDLAERYRQLRGFDEAESALIDALTHRPDRLPREHEHTLRLALNLARLWAVPTSGDQEVIVGPKLGAFRDRLRPLARRIAESRDLDPRAFGHDATTIRPMLSEAKEQLMSAFTGRLLGSAIDAEVSNKSLVLAVGGGGGCGYVHLGAFSVLESIGAQPHLVAGSSIGSILGLFRCRERRYRDRTVEAVTHGLTFRKLFRVLEGDSRYGLPGTLRLYLRTALSRFFMKPDGNTVRIGDLDIPFICVVTGLQRAGLNSDVLMYEREFRQQLRRGAFGALLHLKDLVKSWASLMSDIIKSGGIKAIALGEDDGTREFDALDAVGFSCAVPALIHYDILRDDPRMHDLMRGVLREHGVDHLVDGGISANVPARSAWCAVQRGRIRTRNVFVLGLDCFAPSLRRHMIFSPLMRLAAENVARDRAFAHHVFRYRRVLSPAALVPRTRALHNAIRNGRDELRAIAPMLQKALEPLPSIGAR